MVHKPIPFERGHMTLVIQSKAMRHLKWWKYEFWLYGFVRSADKSLGGIALTQSVVRVLCLQISMLHAWFQCWITVTLAYFICINVSSLFLRSDLYKEHRDQLEIYHDLLVMYWATVALHLVSIITKSNLTSKSTNDFNRCLS